MTGGASVFSAMAMVPLCRPRTLQHLSLTSTSTSISSISSSSPSCLWDYPSFCSAFRRRSPFPSPLFPCPTASEDFSVLAPAVQVFFHFGFFWLPRTISLINSFFERSISLFIFFYLAERDISRNLASFAVHESF